MLTLEDALAELGETPEAIATTLGKKGCKGSRQDDSRCPIAVYLTGLDFTDPSVDQGGVSVYRDDDFLWVSTSDAIDDFLDAFDNWGEWPELVAEEPC